MNFRERAGFQCVVIPSVARDLLFWLRIETDSSGYAPEEVPAKVVMVACMRKLLTIMNSMIKDNTQWHPKTA